MTTPDMIAETWLGALACAPGSQKCNGITPALRPNPTKTNTMQRAVTPCPNVCGATGVIANEPVTCRHIANSANSASTLTWVEIK